MRLIMNRTEYANEHPYSKDRIKEWPKSYPVVMAAITVNAGGLAGECVIVKLYYPPTSAKDNTQPWFWGFNAGYSAAKENSNA